jgi:glycerol-3-phosphate dehydrogenase subunit C
VSDHGGIDPRAALYLDEADVRNELTRTFDICAGCRRCVDLCPAFPTLFDLIDRLDGETVDAGLLTPYEQDSIVDECFQCGRCSAGCPYRPGLVDTAIDVPRLVVRARSMRRSTGQVTLRRRLRDQLAARTDLVGRIAVAFPPLRRALTPTGSPPFARHRFSTWFARRPVGSGGRPASGPIVVFPTCLVEYRETEVGKDLVVSLDDAGWTCTVGSTRCCGAPWLHQGDVERFEVAAQRTVAALAPAAGRGERIVVAQPACAAVIRHEYVAYLPDDLQASAMLVAQHVVGPGDVLDRGRGESQHDPSG